MSVSPCIRIRRNHCGHVEALAFGVDARDKGLEHAPHPRHRRALLVHEEDRPDARRQQDGAGEGCLEDIAAQLTSTLRLDRPDLGDGGAKSRPLQTDPWPVEFPQIEMVPNILQVLLYAEKRIFGRANIGFPSA